MASAKTRSKHSQALCTQYKNENRYAKNKVKKIARHLKKQPNDKAAQAALKAAASAKPTRGVSAGANSKWSREWKDFAHLRRLLGYTENVLDTFAKLQRNV